MRASKPSRKTRTAAQQSPIHTEPPQAKLGPLVLIEWNDASSKLGGIWHDGDDVHDLAPLLVRSVGWIVREDKTAVVIAAHTHSSGDGHRLGGDLCVPKAIISKRVTLKEGR